MKVLIVAPIHQPEALAHARAVTPPGEMPPLFTPTDGFHPWEKTLRDLGHTVYAFYRNQSALPLLRPLSENRLVRGVSQRVPQLNPDYRRRNHHLRTMARVLKPELILIAGDNEVIYPQTLAAIKAETGATLAYFCGTSPIVFSHSNDRGAARLYDLVIANDYYHGIQWRELGTPRLFLPGVACDPDVHRAYPLSEDEQRLYGCDISFVGTLYPDNLYSRRVALLEALRDFDLAIWSVHHVPESLRPFVRGSAIGAQMLRILSASKITLNPHGDFMLYGGNMRLFEAAGVGTFQLTDDLPGIHTWFTPGENIVTFSSAADLREKAAYYLANPAERTQIARAGQQHVYTHHTYRQRVGAVMALVQQIRESSGTL